MGSKKISIILPCHNEEMNIPFIVKSILQNLQKSTYEIILVDDGSTDSTWKIIVNLSAKDKEIKGIKLSRNFGHQAALEAGLKLSSGKAIIMMDCDAQHPAEIIPKLIDKWEEGYDIVNTKRIDSADVGLVKKITGRLFYWTINKISTIHLEQGSADFRLISFKVAKELNKLTEKDKFYRGLINWVGYKTDTIEYHAKDRLYGKSSYSFGKMLALARVGLTSFSMLPLKLILVFGIMLSVLGIMGFIGMLACNEILNERFFSGTAILALFIVANNGMVIVLLGIVSIYQINLLKEVQNRPSYIVETKVNL